MAKTWRFKFAFTVGGGGKGNRFTNTMHINTDAALDSEAIKTIATDLATGMRPALLDIVTIQSVTISDPARAGQGYDPATVRTIGIGLNGTKVMGAEHPEIKEVVVKFTASGATGRPGHLSLRMMAYDSEVTGAGNGEPSAVGLPSGVPNILNTLNGAITAGISFRIWNKNKAGTVTDRPITAFAYQGVGYRDAHIKRHKKKVGTTPAAWRDSMEDVVKKVLEAVGGYQVAKTGIAPAINAVVEPLVAAFGEGASAILPELPAIAAAL